MARAYTLPKVIVHSAFYRKPVAFLKLHCSDLGSVFYLQAKFERLVMSSVE